jgi:hypothetical protein
MIDWKSKLTSRKLWMALVGLVSGILLAFKMDEQTVTQISGIIMAGASVVAYIIGEGLIDAASASSDAPLVIHTGKEEKEKDPE